MFIQSNHPLSKYYAESPMRTRVCITVDTEFSIGGAFNDGARLPVAEPAVWCNTNGRSEGLGFMLDTLDQYHVPATFFVETVHRYFFRQDPMRDVVRRVQDKGHDVQLHTHPCWTIFQHDDWRHRQAPRDRDDFVGRELGDTLGLLRQGLETFSDWDLPRPLSFRSGNLQHDSNLYRALAEVNIPYASNVGLAIFDSGDANYALYSGRHDRHGVSEFPVLTFSDWKMGPHRHLKSLTIAGTSFPETVTLLEKARQAQIPLVVLLTHPFEFVHRQDVTFRHMNANRLTQQRLVQLCQFLQRNNDRFEATSFTQAAAACSNIPEHNTLLETSLHQSLTRMVEQMTHDKLGRLALAYTAP